MNKKTFFVIVCLLVAIIAGLLIWDLWFEEKTVTKNGNNVLCTQEAKLCPDGSSVGRTGSNCEFAECPAIDETADWSVYTNDEFGFEFKYPKDLNINSEEGDIMTVTLKSENRKPPIDWSISIHDNSDMTLEEWAENNTYNKDNITSTTINGIDAKRINWGDVGVNATIIYVLKDNFIYEITGINMVSSEAQQEEYDAALFEQMFSTFKFINQ